MTHDNFIHDTNWISKNDPYNCYRFDFSEFISHALHPQGVKPTSSIPKKNADCLRTDFAKDVLGSKVCSQNRIIVTFQEL